MKKNKIKKTENNPSTLQKNNKIQISNKTSEQNMKKEELHNISINSNNRIITKKIKLKRNIKRVKNKNIEAKILENIIYNNFILKYKYMTIYYNSIISDRLINNIRSHIVTSFKEFLIFEEIFEFINKYYKKKESSLLLKEIINFYVSNELFFPNYSILLEKNYLLRNIQEKQKLLENKENKKKKKEKNKEKEDEDNIFTSKVMNSILNQTNTSDAINILGLDKNNNNEDSDIEKIDILIKNVKNIENKDYKNKIFYKKKLIKFGGDNNINNNKICKLSQYVNIADNKPKKLNENINEDQSRKTLNFESLSKTNIINKCNNINNYSLKNNEGKYFSKINSINNNESNLSKDNFNSNNNERKRNTIEDTQKKFRRKMLFSHVKENDIKGKSLKNLIYPYIKPIKQSLSYSKKKIDKNSSNKYNEKKKNNFYKECLNNSSYQKYFNNDINFINRNVYTKKIYKVYTRNILNTTNSEKTEYINYVKDKNIENDIINNEVSKTDNRIKSYRINKGIRTNNLTLNSHLNISSSRKSLNTSYSNKTRNYHQNSKKIYNNIPKILKRKLFIDEDMKASINNKSNTNFNYNRNNTITNTSSIKKKKLFIISEKEKDKNMIEDNNIIAININQNTYLSINNAYSTINNHSRKKKKMVIKIEKKMRSEKQKNKNIIIIKNDEYFETFGKNSDKNLTLKNQNSIYDSKREINKYTISIRNNRILTPQKNKLINETRLTSLDKKSIKYFLNKFNDKNNSNKIIEINKKLNSNYNNPQRFSNNEDLNNIQVINSQNKIGKRRKYIVLRDRNAYIYK